MKILLPILIVAAVAVWFLACRKRGQSTRIQLPTAKDIDDGLAMEPTDAVIAINRLVGAKCEKNGFGSLSHAEQVYFAVDYLQAEVNNGGFHQHFFNSSGEYAHEAVAGLREIGAEKMASIAQKACEIFPEKKVPKGREERWKLMELNEYEKEEVLNSLDEEFYKYPEPVDELLLDYARNHRDEFR